MFDPSQNQNVGNNSKAFQSTGRDAIDNSQTHHHYYESIDTKVYIDYEIISEIFDHLLTNNLNDTKDKHLEKPGKLTHLKEKIPLNFSNEGEKTIKEWFVNLWDKKDLVGRYIEAQNENGNGDEVNGLVLKFQEYFMNLKKTQNHEVKIVDVQIFNKLARYCIPKKDSRDARFEPNALAIVLYFFERCDFGMKTQNEQENNPTLF